LNKDILLHEIYFDISGFYCNMFLRSMPGCGALEAFSTNRFLLHDSYSHFLSSAFIYCWQYETLKNAAHIESGTSRMWAFSLTTFYGILKEIFDDKVQGQHFSYKDIACNVAGSLMMYILWK